MYMNESSHSILFLTRINKKNYCNRLLLIKDTTLHFRINVGPMLIYFCQFSHAYALIQVPMLITFQEFEKDTWNLPMNSLNQSRKNTVKPFETKILLTKIP